MTTRKMDYFVKPVLVETEPGAYDFAGTGFYVKYKEIRLFVTALHVVDGYDSCVLDLTGDEKVFQLRDLLVETTLLFEDKVHDLAILKTSCDRGESFEICTERPALNLKVGTFEYSRFTINEYEKTLNDNPSSRVGNVVRIANDTRYPFSVLELSYPALKGASGAPVMFLEGSDSYKVIGVVISNAQYELLPVQKYEYNGPDGEEEKTHYYLPAGIAVPSDKLIIALEEAINKNET